MQHITGNKGLVFPPYSVHYGMPVSFVNGLRNTTEMKLSACTYPLSEVLTEGKTHR